MKILFVLENYYPHIGGVETLFKQLSEALVARGHEVTVFTSRVVKSSPRKETINGVSIERFWSGNRYLFTFLSMFKVFSLARKHNHVHTTSYNAALPAWIGAKMAGRSCTITFHEVWDELWLKLPWMSSLGAQLHRAFEKLILHLSFDRYIGVSQFTVKRLLHFIPKNRVQLIYNGIDYDEIKEYKISLHDLAAISTEPVLQEIAVLDTSRPKKNYQFIYVGRLGVSKGLDLLIPAFSAFAKKHPQSRLKLILPKQPELVLRKIFLLIQQEKIENFVKIEHELNFQELCRSIQSSDAVVIPSYSEGFCYVAVESSALNVPIVSSGCGALSETVSGQYIELTELTVETLASALELAYTNQWEFREYRRFSLAAAVDDYVALFNEFAQS